MARMSFVEAVCTGLAQEMRRDSRVWALGEDVEYGGLYGQYRGLLEEFGSRRIVSTPISEATIMGAGLGAAMVGTRPVVEMRIADFALCAVDELVNQIAKARYMFGGQARVPVVVRMPQGVFRNSAAQHSQSFEGLYAHIPGLVVVAPSTPADSRGLLKAAIRCDDPVVILEPKALWQQEDDVPEGVDDLTPIGTARTAREGRDVTLVTWSALVHPSLEAAQQAGDDGISVEVIDLRSIWPWDREAVFASVARTGRLVVAHESTKAGGFGAEIAATVVEEFGDRAVRMRRVGAPRTPVPFSPPLERGYRVGVDEIVDAVRAVVA